MLKKGRKYSTNEDFYFSVFVFLVGFAGLVLSINFVPRAKILPQAVSGLLIFLAIIEIWKKREFIHKYKNKQTSNKESAKPFFNVLSVTIIGILLYPAFLYLLGFIVSSIILMAFFMYIREIRSPIKIGIFSLITPILVFFLFNTLAGVRLPEGPWGF